MNSIKSLFIAGAVVLTGVVSTSAFAQAAMDQSKMAANTAPVDMSDAEVRKVDVEQGKVTLKHGPIKNLDMPPMTMVFTVKDKAMLDSVKTGDKVKFKAVNENGKMTVVEIAPAK